MASPPSVRHPFSWVAPADRGRLFAVLLVLVVLTSIALSWLGAPLATEGAPYGIVSYEFAGNEAGARRVLDSWGAAERERAMLTLGLDYLYLLLYPACIALGCVLVAGRRGQGERLARIGIALAWAVPVAGLLDAVENAALIRLLIEGPGDAPAVVAAASAAPKFALVVAGILYAAVGWLASFRSSA